MDEKLKYRLVGATVLFALAAFFLPLILDSEKYRTQIESQIPAIPVDAETEPGSSTDSESLDTSDSTEGSLIINLNDEAPIEPNEVPVTTNSEPETSEKITEEPVAVQPEVEDKAIDIEPEVQKAEVKPEVVPEKKTPIIKTKPLPEKKEPVFTETDFVIQVATFSEKSNATKLVKRLRDEGYRAYTRPNQALTRVFVGPYPDKTSADKRKSSLEKVINGKVVVLPFDTKVH